MDVNVIDDSGTDESGARTLLENLCSNGFDGDIGEAAVVLGRTPEELQNILDGDEPADEDLIMKIRGVARERDINID